MARRYDTVSFLTDYGLEDEFVGVVKSVIRDIAPHVSVIDLTHQVAPYDVRGGSLTLVRTIQYVPSGVVLAVVDPGVGTSRRAVAVEVAEGEGVLVGPDNGLLAPAVAMVGGAERAVVLDKAEYHLQAPGPTFAGRDVFAPAVAHLCNGVELSELGELIEPGVLMPGLVPLPRYEGDELVTEVLWVDHFGNVQLNVGPDDVSSLGGRVLLRFGSTERLAVRSDTFATINAGEIGLLVDSYGLMAICLDRRSAAAELGLHAGDQIRLSEPTDGTGWGVSTPVAFRR